MAPSMTPAPAAVIAAGLRRRTGISRMGGTGPSAPHQISVTWVLALMRLFCEISGVIRATPRLWSQTLTETILACYDTVPAPLIVRVFATRPFHCPLQVCSGEYPCVTLPHERAKPYRSARSLGGSGGGQRGRWRSSSGAGASRRRSAQRQSLRRQAAGGPRRGRRSSRRRRRRCLRVTCCAFCSASLGGPFAAGHPPVTISCFHAFLEPIFLFFCWALA